MHRTRTLATAATPASPAAAHNLSVRIVAKNIEDFMAIYDENIEVFDMWGLPWIYRGAQSWRGMAEEWFRGLGDERVVVDIENMQVKPTPQMAFVSAFVKYTALSREGKPR